MLNEHWMQRTTWAASVALVLVGAWVQAQEQQAPQPQEQQFKVQRFVRLAGGDEVKEFKISDYWLGLECYPLDVALRSHLDLPEGTGLTIEQVMPESPAAKVGFKQHDVLIQAGDKRLKTVAELIAAVDDAKEKELSVDLIRGGKAITIKVTPAKRPQGDVLKHADTGRFIAQWLQQHGKANEAVPGQQEQFSIRVLQPGARLPGMPAGPMPKDVSISITKQGEEPAKVMVKKGDKTWEATEGKLTELPDDVRPFVERMLGRGTIMMLKPPPGAVPGIGVVPALPPVPGHGGAIAEPRTRVEVRRFESNTSGNLKDISEQLDRLRKQVDELQKALPKAEKPAEGKKPAEVKPPANNKAAEAEEEASAI